MMIVEKTSKIGEKAAKLREKSHQGGDLISDLGHVRSGIKLISLIS